MAPTIEKMYSEKYKSLFKAKLRKLHLVERKLEVLKKKCRMMKVKSKLIRNQNIDLKRYEKLYKFKCMKKNNGFIQKAKTLNVGLQCTDYFITQLENHNKQLQKENEQLEPQNQNSSATSEEMENLRAEYRSFQRNVEREHHANLERPQIEIIV